MLVISMAEDRNLKVPFPLSFARVILKIPDYSSGN